MNFTVLGCGRWGSCIAWYLDKIGNNVTLWGMKEDDYVKNFFITRKNDYLELPNSIKTTFDLKEALTKSDYIVISISSQHLREFMGKVIKEDVKNKKFILCMKGIEESSGKRLSEVLIDSGIDKNNIAVWVGPGHIQGFLDGIPGVMLIDSYNEDLAMFLVKTLRSNLIRFYKGNDIIGSEIGAAAKNVIGIAAGMLDGINFASLKGALMARGAREISRLIKACGGSELSAYGLCHLGDYEATLFSPFSHNRAFGEKFIKGEKFNKLAEGVKTATALLKLAETVNVDLPITRMVDDILNGIKEKDEAILYLMGRDNLIEF